MVHPHAFALLHRHGVGAVVGLRLPEIDVPDDDVVRADAEDANPVHHEGVGAVEAQVGDVLDVEPGMGLGEIAAVLRSESAAEPDGYGRMVALLLGLGPVQEPGLEGLAVVEMEDVGRGSRVAAGHARGVAVEMVQRHRPGLGRVRALELALRIGFHGRFAFRREGELVEAERISGRIDLHCAFLHFKGKDSRARRGNTSDQRSFRTIVQDGDIMHFRFNV